MNSSTMPISPPFSTTTNTLGFDNGNFLELSSPPSTEKYLNYIGFSTVHPSDTYTSIKSDAPIPDRPKQITPLKIPKNSDTHFAIPSEDSLDNLPT
ncbi:hypothetical protein SLA2020_526240 [Shorea laevis]